MSAQIISINDVYLKAERSMTAGTGLKTPAEIINGRQIFLDRLIAHALEPINAQRPPQRDYIDLGPSDYAEPGNVSPT